MFLYYSYVPEALEDNEKKKQLYSVAWLAEMVCQYVMYVV